MGWFKRIYYTCKMGYTIYNLFRSYKNGRWASLGKTILSKLPLKLRFGMKAYLEPRHIRKQKEKDKWTH